MPIFLLSDGAEIENENTHYTRVYGSRHPTREKKSYLHRFKLTDNTTCPCNEGHQTPEHLTLNIPRGSSEDPRG